jgi:hypothetical protein
VTRRRLRILWIATKPPWPPVDGGRLAAFLTLEALAAAGAELTVVAPAPAGGPAATERAAAAEAARRGLAGICQLRLVAARQAAPRRDLVRALAGAEPYSILRHRQPGVRRMVARTIEEGGCDVVHAEQLQAFAQAAPALGRRPVVLRAQNVESDLWEGLARQRGRPWRALLRREARRLAVREGEAVSRAAAVVALTAPDAARLAALAIRSTELAARSAGPAARSAAGAARVLAVPVPFPERLPAGREPLAGEPPLVLLGGRTWAPNRDGERWFLREIWPAVAAAVPAARLHRFGDGLPDSRAAFPPGAVLVVPLRVASGVRMKILEAWAREVPAVATPEAASGLEAGDGEALLLAADASGFVRALSRLDGERGLRERLIAGGHRALRERHSPPAVAEMLLGLYGELTGTS